MQLKIAELSDIKATLKLHYKYQIDTIQEEDKADGFVTTPFTKEQLTNLIEKEKGLFIAKKGEVVFAYAMAASWDFWSIWPMFAHMIEELPKLKYQGQEVTTENSYQYGPICVEKSYRGSGLLEDLFDFAREEMARKFSILVTFVNTANPRSYEAHSRKLKLDTVQEFEYNGKNYYEMMSPTSRKVVPFAGRKYE